MELKDIVGKKIVSAENIHVDCVWMSPDNDKYQSAKLKKVKDKIIFSHHGNDGWIYHYYAVDENHYLNREALILSFEDGSKISIVTSDCGCGCDLLIG